jgi:AdoMet-dependent heme synthase
MNMDFNERPFIVIWEVTQACDLACVHCRASAQTTRHPLELTTDEGKKLIDEVAEIQAPVFVLTGGDPLRRPDIYDLVGYAAGRGVRISMTPSATPLLTREAIASLRQSGLARLAVSLDGSTAEIHDAFRGIPGSYERTFNAIRWARQEGLPVQINTSITRRNLNDFEAIARRLESLDIVLWSVFFLVPTGRGRLLDLISAEEFEWVFEKLYRITPRVPFDIKTTEAQHYRRYALQQRARENRAGAGGAATAAAMPRSTPDGIGRAPRGINDGKGFVFISHLGDVFPSGFLPVSAGNVRQRPLAEIYRETALFKSLRDTGSLKGKCGICEFREVCGGSRSRAYAVTGDAFAEEPCCIYIPKGAQPASAGVRPAPAEVSTN